MTPTIQFNQSNQTTTNQPTGKTTNALKKNCREGKYHERWPWNPYFLSTQNHAYSILVLAPSTTGAANIPAVVMKHLEKLHPLEFYTYKTTFLVSKNF